MDAVPPSGGLFEPSAPVPRSCPLPPFSPERGHLCAKKEWGAVRAGTLTSGHPVFWEHCRTAPHGNRTWNLDYAAYSVQGPLSAAAGINTARPRGQISLPKSLWPRKRWRKLDRGDTRRPSFHGGPCCRGGLGLPITGHIPWAQPGLWVTGNRLWRAGRLGRLAGFHCTSAAPPPQP